MRARPRPTLVASEGGCNMQAGEEAGQQQTYHRAKNGANHHEYDVLHEGIASEPLLHRREFLVHGVIEQAEHRRVGLQPSMHRGDLTTDSRVGVAELAKELSRRRR